MDPTTAPQNAENPPPSPQRDQQPGPPRNNNYRRGGYRGERGRGFHNRGQSNGRGRGSRQEGFQHRPAQNGPHVQLGAHSKPQEVNGTGPAQSANTDGVVNSADPNGEEDVEAEVCFICASPVVHNSIAACNHRTCHICALRMRALYKNKACLHCRTISEYVIFTDDPNKRYEDFTDQDFARTDDSLGIKYEKPDIFEDTVLLLRYNCPDPSCDIACYGWPDLHRHVRNVHGKVMCDLCTRNKKVFTHEHTLFTHNELRKHEKQGDDQPGAINQSGFRGHPDCGFCHQRFYGDDELYTHCRDKHERCHICDRRSQGREQQYYLDYDALEVHFKKDHFLCADSECLEKKFVVFESEMDLKAHQLEAHPNGLSKDARRDARRVDMSSFDYRQPHREPRGGQHREGRGRGRGRDPNVEALPVSSAQPMRRDELAFQRQLAIHSAQSISTRNFGGQLTSGDAFAAAAPAGTATPPTVTAPRSADSSRPGDENSSSPTTPTVHHQSPIDISKFPPHEQARQLRHQAVLTRASNLLHNSPTKLATFRTYISDYRTSSVTAEALIDSFFALFDAPSSEMGILIKELADIYESAEKRAALLKAWNDWRAINEDYPSLPGPDGLPAGGGTNAGSGGKRILKLKSSTTKSSQSAAARTGTWAGASGSSGPSRPAAGGGAFPNLPPANRTAPPKVRTAAWALTATPSTNPAMASSNSAARPLPASSRPATASTRVPASTSSAAFPSLPAAQKPGMNVSRPGYIGNPVLKVRSGTSTPAVSAWSGPAGGGAGGMNMSSVSAALNATTDGDDEDGDAAGKRKGKKKQTLYHWG